MKSKADLISIAAIIALPIICFLPELSGSVVFAGFDFTHLILPLQQFAKESLLSGGFPHWNPNIFAGFPQLAEGEGGFFYPGNLLLFLPGEQAVWLSWTIVLHIILAGLLMFWFLRVRGASAVSAGWLSVFYQFLPGLILRTETVGLFEAMVWIPGFYASIELAVDSGSRKIISGWILWTALASAEIAMMLLAGSSQIAFYTMVGSVFYLIGIGFMGPNHGSKAAWSTATFFIAAIFASCLAAVQLVPTSGFSEFSHRMQSAGFSYYVLGTWLTLPRLASLFLFPAIKNPSEVLDYTSSIGYLGLLPFLLVGIALSLSKNRMNPILPAFFLAFFGTILAFGFNIPTWYDLITFPGFNLFRALGRMIIPTTVAFYALAAIGLDGLLALAKDESNRKSVTGGIVIASIVATFLLMWILISAGIPISDFEIIGLIGLGVSILAVCVGLSMFMGTKRLHWLNGLLIFWLIFHIAVQIPIRSAITIDRKSYNSFREKISELHDALDDGSPASPRVIVADKTDVWNPLVERLKSKPFSPGNSLPIPALGNELSMGGVGVLNGYTPLIPECWYIVASEYLAKGFADVDEASTRSRAVMSILGVDGVIVPGHYTGGGDFVPVDIDLSGLFPADWHLLKTPSPVEYAGIPRIVDARKYVDWEEFKHDIVQADFVPGENAIVEIPEDFSFPDNEMIVESDVATEFESGSKSDEDSSPVIGKYILDDRIDAEIISVERRAGNIEINARSDTPCWLVVRESYMPGWEVTVDGVESEIFPVDYLYCTIPLGAGEHEVTMKYSTPGLREGGIFSGVAWIIFLAIMIIAVPLQVGRKTLR